MAEDADCEGAPAPSNAGGALVESSPAAPRAWPAGWLLLLPLRLQCTSPSWAARGGSRGAADGRHVILKSALTADGAEEGRGGC
eukprot:6190179-Pleurochrysis_carterae.AAC.1